MRTVDVTFYDPETGAIVGGGSYPPDYVEANCPPGMAWRKGYYSGTKHRVRLTDKRPVALMKSKARTDGNIVTGIPDGAAVEIDGMPVEVKGGKLPLLADYPAEVTVRVEHPLFNDACLAITVDPARNGKTGVRLEQDYRGLRERAYPSDREQIGALVKAVQALIAGETVPGDALAVIAGVQAVKAALPKP